MSARRWFSGSVDVSGEGMVCLCLCMLTRCGSKTALWSTACEEVELMKDRDQDGKKTPKGGWVGGAERKALGGMK